MTLSSSSINFSGVTAGTTSSVRSVTLTNRESVALAIGSIAVSAGFAVASNTCGASVAAGLNCAVGVTFSPTAVGPVSGTLTFTDAALTSPQVVTLSGSGR
jgi:hypothetical protein